MPTSHNICIVWAVTEIRRRTNWLVSASRTVASFFSASISPGPCPSCRPLHPAPGHRAAGRHRGRKNCVSRYPATRPCRKRRPEACVSSGRRIPARLRRCTWDCLQAAAAIQSNRCGFRSDQISVRSSSSGVKGISHPRATQNTAPWRHRVAA